MNLVIVLNVSTRLRMHYELPTIRVGKSETYRRPPGLLESTKVVHFVYMPLFLPWAIHEMN